MPPLDMEPDMEDDTIDLPKHVYTFDRLLELYGVEPISGWRAQDVASAFACLHRELLERGMEKNVPIEGELATDDGV